MNKSSMLFLAFSALFVPTGCETKVQGYGVGSGNLKHTAETEKSLQEEIQRLKAERLKSRAKSNGN